MAWLIFSWKDTRYLSSIRNQKQLEKTAWGALNPPGIWAASARTRRRKLKRNARRPRKKPREPPDLPDRRRSAVSVRVKRFPAPAPPPHCIHLIRCRRATLNPLWWNRTPAPFLAGSRRVLHHVSSTYKWHKNLPSGRHPPWLHRKHNKPSPDGLSRRKAQS